MDRPKAANPSTAQGPVTHQKSAAVEVEGGSGEPRFPPTAAARARLKVEKLPGALPHALLGVRRPTTAQTDREKQEHAPITFFRRQLPDFKSTLISLPMAPPRATETSIYMIRSY